MTCPPGLGVGLPIRASARSPGCGSATSAWSPSYKARKIIEVQSKLSALLDELATGSATPTDGEKQ
jgi:hypothetical protein